MKNKILIPLFIIGALAAFFSFKHTGRGRSSDDKRKLVIETVMAAIEHEHYSPRAIDDSFSTHVFHKVLDYFDNGKIFFTKQDVQKLGAYEFKIDDEMKEHSLEFFDSLDAIYIRRIAGAEHFYTEILKQPFSFNTNERVETDPKKESYPDGEAGLTERWRQTLKLRTLEKFVELKDAQEKKKKDSASAKMKTDVELEVDAREDTRKLYERIFKRMHKMKDDDRFTMFMNQIVETQDPHTEYFPPVDKAGFDATMSGSFFGIGAQLREDGDKIKIVAIVTGSPSWKQGELKADDEILKVAQGDGKPVDVMGFEINDVVRLIRGDKGTEVRLTVKKTDGSIKVISLRRDVVKLEETFAKSAIINEKEMKIGYIRLPEFYADFNHSSGRRCATDIKEEVQHLRAEGVKGIILDLRGNGGGSLGDVVEMGSVFVGRGPMVQVKNSGGAVNVLRSQGSDTAIYSGPFIIMVDEGSASASEILAAAMQDYRRAVIVGAPTYGKGTVQKMVGLDDILNPLARIQLNNDTNNADPSLGALKLTMEKFYRINGGSTQLKGVTPDIVLPDAYDYLEDEDLGERRNKSALAWDEIAPAKYTPANSVFNIEQLEKMSQSRIAESANFKLIEKTAKSRKKKMEDRSLSLNEKQYRKEQEEINAIGKQMEENQKKATNLEVVNLAIDKDKYTIDSAAVTKNKDWLKNLGKDIYINETVNIIKDLAKATTTLTMKKEH
jgi:carboxyl-terminal processing protease